MAHKNKSKFNYLGTHKKKYGKNLQYRMLKSINQYNILSTDLQ